MVPLVIDHNCVECSQIDELRNIKEAHYGDLRGWGLYRFVVFLTGLVIAVLSYTGVYTSAGRNGVAENSQLSPTREFPAPAPLQATTPEGSKMSGAERNCVSCNSPRAISFEIEW